MTTGPGDATGSAGPGGSGPGGRTPGTSGPTVPLGGGVEWVHECYPLGDAHLHVSCYLVRAGEGALIVDSGSFYHRASLSRKLRAATEPDGVGALILSHSDYPHSGNIPAFRGEWGDFDIVASSADADIQGLPYARRSRIGETLHVLGRPFVFLDPPLADRSHTTWIYDPEARVIFTADGFGNLHRPGACALTSRDLPDGVRTDDLHAFHRDTLRWLVYVDPPRLLAALERIFREHPVEWVAPIHGNPIAGADLPAYMDALRGSVERIVGGGA
ncbi:MAG TPA: MBL fold metallo-hydrolase [Longimicrobiales bacterium]|nr:MBL fold metallo-hydrolase [Longimicrobiales bacterium]